jgi:hypothetical protein
MRTSFFPTGGCLEHDQLSDLLYIKYKSNEKPIKGTGGFGDLPESVQLCLASLNYSKQSIRDSIPMIIHQTGVDIHVDVI